MRQAMVEYEGCRLAYECQGTGPASIFQGVGVQGRGWQPQTSQISKTHMCIDYDNRGLGKSQPNTTAISLSQLAQDARAILDDAQVPTAHVVGHSLGGLIALQLALDFPERVRSLSLLCTFTGSRTAAPLSARLIWFGIRSRLGTRSMRRNGFMRLVMPRAKRWTTRFCRTCLGMTSQISLRSLVCNCVPCAPRISPIGLASFPHLLLSFRLCMIQSRPYQQGERCMLVSSGLDTSRPQTHRMVCPSRTQPGSISCCSNTFMPLRPRKPKVPLPRRSGNASVIA